MWAGVGANVGKKAIRGLQERTLAQVCDVDYSGVPPRAALLLGWSVGRAGHREAAGEGRQRQGQRLWEILSRQEGELVRSRRGP